MSALEAALAAQHTLGESSRDPLSRWLFSSVEARRFVERLRDEDDEGVLRAGNIAGKTTLGAMLGVAAAVGCTSIDGRTIHEARDGVAPWPLELPRYPVPNVGILVVSSYKQASESTLSAYRRLLGERPHVFVGGAMMTEAIYVQPDGVTSMDRADWSKILVFTTAGAVPAGIRAHWAHGDETPPRKLWDEVRMRRMAGQPYRRWITHTPVDPNLYEWLRDELDQSGRLEVVLRVLDNQALTEADKAAILRDLEHSLLRDARLNGDYVNLAGKNPFQAYLQTLSALEGACRKPKVDPVEVWSEHPEGGAAELATLDLELFQPPQEGHSYWVLGDSSIGVEDGEHDPCGMWVINRTEPGLDARYNGFVGSYGLGALMAWAGEWYNDATCWPDRGGGYGGPAITAMRQYRSERYPSGYHRIGHGRTAVQREKRSLPGYDGMRVFDKAEAVEHIKVWLARRGAGFRCPSLPVLRCLGRATLDKSQRLVKVGGAHYEDLVLLGYGLRLLGTFGIAAKQEPTNAERFEKVLRSGREIPIPHADWAITPRVRSL